MSSVMIRCPISGEPVSTAIEVEPNVFRKLPKISRPHALPGLRTGARLGHEFRLACG